MKLNEISNQRHTRRLAGLLMSFFILTVALTPYSCVRVEMPEPEQMSDNIGFAISVSDSWSKTSEPQTKSAVAGPVKLADSLYLHTLNSIISGSSLLSGETAAQDEPQTRAAVATDMRSTFRVAAAAYTGDWNKTTGSQAPNLFTFLNAEYDSQSRTYNIAEENKWQVGKNHAFFAYSYSASNTEKNLTEAVLSTDDGFGNLKDDLVLDLTIPDNYADQNDLLVAFKHNIPSPLFGGKADLEFRHPLTCIRFTSSDKMSECTLQKIVLTNIVSSGRYNFRREEWSMPGAKKSYEISFQTAGQTDGLHVGGTGTVDDITIAGQELMMMPQTLADNAQMQIYVRKDGSDKVLTANLKDASPEWGKGKRITYELSNSSITITNVFEVTLDDRTVTDNPNQTWKDYEYTGGSTVLKVHSYHRDGNGKTTPLGWEAQYSVKEGEWLKADVDTVLTGMPNSTALQGTDGTTPFQTTLNLSIKPVKKHEAHNERLRNTPPKTSRYNLATKGDTEPMTTANCYIVNGPGTYVFPLMWGNQIMNGKRNPDSWETNAFYGSYNGASGNGLDKETDLIKLYPMNQYAAWDTTSPKVMWQDVEGLVTDVKFVSLPDLPRDVYQWYVQGLEFKVNKETIEQGNAVICMTSGLYNQILWTWHIWVTDYDPDAEPSNERFDPQAKATDRIVTNANGQEFRFMGANIGWVDETRDEYKERTVVVRLRQTGTEEWKSFTLHQKPEEIIHPGYSPYYQWGRKDPFPGSDDAVTHNYIMGDFKFPATGKNYPTSEVNIKTSAEVNTHDSGLHNTPEFNTDRWRSMWACVGHPQYFFGSNAGYGYRIYHDYFYYVWDRNLTTGYTDNLNWGSTSAPVRKTVYDPSPRGYCVPPAEAFSGFGKKTDGQYGTKVNLLASMKGPDMSVQHYNDIKGMELYCNGTDGARGTIYFPGVSYMNESNGIITADDSGNMYNFGQYWKGRSQYIKDKTIAPTQAQGGTAFYWNFGSANGRLDPNDSMPYSRGASIRPVRQTVN